MTKETFNKLNNQIHAYGDIKLSIGKNIASGGSEEEFKTLQIERKCLQNDILDTLINELEVEY